MQLTEDKGQGNHINSYQSGLITVNSQSYQHNIVIMPDQVISDWSPLTVNDLRSDHFDELMVYRPELILLGTGSTSLFPPATLYANLLVAHIGVEVMPTPAACRTYNLLMSDARRVLAALFL